MKKLLLLLVLSQATLLAQTKEEAEVLNLSKRKFRWMVEARLDSLKDLLDDRLSYIHSSGWIQSKKEFLDDFTNGKLTYHVIDIMEISVRLYLKSAVVTGKGRFTTSLNGNKATVDLIFTEVYVLQKKQWKFVSRHASRLP